MIKIGDMIIEDWKDVFATGKHYGRVVYSDTVSFIGRIWVDKNNHGNIWTIDFTGDLIKMEMFLEAMPKQTFSSVEEAKLAVDNLLARMRNLISFV